MQNFIRVRDTSPKTTLPKRHLAETTLCRMRHFAEILPKFGKNAEKDVFKSISYNVIFFITFSLIHSIITILKIKFV